MYYVPEGTTRCGYYECESCGEKFLSLQTMEHINCPYCEAEFDPEIGPDETMQVAEDTAKLIQDRKSTRLNSSHSGQSRMPSSA